jgi:N-methylhydantoinase A/oxoprolinase/acetone carboxylase beta subunit
MIKQGKTDLENELIPPEKIEIAPSLDVRYAGQSYELNVPYSDGFLSDFKRAHDVAYGYSYTGKEIEIVNLRIRAIGKTPRIHLPERKVSEKHVKPATTDNRKIELASGSETVPAYLYDNLFTGALLTGPALIASPDTTIFIDKADRLRVDKYNNLLIDVYPRSKHNC